MPIYIYNGEILVVNGDIAASEACCCGTCPRCIVNGQWDCRYHTEAECEECITTWYCFDYDTQQSVVVADCAECVGENVECYAETTGPCGTWTEGFSCEPCVCDSDADCYPQGLTCEEILPGSPWSCCDGVCKEWGCYPGVQLFLRFRKKAGCAFLPDIAVGEEFIISVAGGSLIGASGCLDSALFASAPCDTRWTLSRGCVVTNLTVDTSVTQYCQDCLEFVSWASCRTDCLGACL